MGGDRFIVMRGDAEEVLTFSNFKAKPKSFSPDIAKYRRDGIGFSVDLADSSILFANGHTSISPDTPRSVKESGGKSGGDMIIYNADSGEESKKPFGVDGYVDSAGFCKKDYICQLDDQTLHIIDTTGSPKEVDRINNVLDFVSMNGTKLAYLQNGQVYVTDITSGFTQLAYRTNNFTISDLHRATSGVLLAGTQKNSGLNSISSAFLLEDEPAKTNVFVDEKIPYPIGAYGFVRSFDYQNKIIRVSIQTARSAAFGSASGGADYNTTEYTQSRSKLLKQLQADGINLDEYMVITKPFAF